MKFRKLGASDLTVSEISLGSWLTYGVGVERDAASAWTALRRDKADVARRTVDDIEAAGGAWTFAKLTIANAALRELAADGAKRKR